MSTRLIWFSYRSFKTDEVYIVICYVLSLNTVIEVIDTSGIVDGDESTFCTHHAWNFSGFLISLNIVTSLRIQQCCILIYNVILVVYHDRISIRSIHWWTFMNSSEQNLQHFHDIYEQWWIAQDRISIWCMTLMNMNRPYQDTAMIRPSRTDSSSLGQNLHQNNDIDEQLRIESPSESWHWSTLKNSSGQNLHQIHI